MRYTFEEITTKRTKRWTDKNGKKRQQTKTFTQTVNPFNKTKSGRVKTRAEIMKEVHVQADAWVKEPVED